MLTPREARAARAFLGWTRQKLADKAVLALNSVIRFEQGVVDPRLSTSQAIRRVFEREGIEFLSPSGTGEGIQARKQSAAGKARKRRDKR